MSTSSYLGDILPGVLGELHKQNRARLYRDDPVLWAEEYLGVQLWSKQKQILYSIRDNSNTAVAAGHGVGKSFIAAVAICWWIDVHPLGSQQTFVATTAPSKDQVDLIWSSVRAFVALSHSRYTGGHVDHPLPGYITGDNKWKLDDGDTIGQGRKPPDNKSDVAFQGRHAPYLLAIGDEAVGLSEGFLTALGSIATADNNRQLLLANPTDPGSAMAKLWPKKDGTGGHPGWERIHISVMDSPMITGEEGFDLARAEGLSGWKYVNEKLDDWGEDDPRFIARVLGEWAWDSGNNLFPEEVIQRACRTVVVPDPAEPWVQFGVDVARMGPDDSVVYEAMVGEIWETDPETNRPVRGTGEVGYHVRFVAAWSRKPITSKDAADPGTAERVDALARAHAAVAVNVDASGIGGTMIDVLRNMEDKPYELYEIFGGSTLNVDRRAYINLRAEQYGELKRLMMQGHIDIDPADEKLLDELRGIRFEWSNEGAMKIESKESMKRRGVKSPDYADALWYSLVDLQGSINTPQPGDLVTADPGEFIEGGGFWFSPTRGVGQFGW